MRPLRAAFMSMLLLAGCPSTEPAKNEKTCSGAEALSPAAQPLRGTSLAAKQLALSFDDGPDARTSELSTYLKGQGIRATFFVNHNAQQNGHLGVLPQLVADGHVVANHTQNHLDLTKQTNTKIVDEVTDVDTLIAPYVVKNRLLFRAPFGAYDTKVYNALQASAMSKYVGHVDWDIGGAYVAGVSAADWSCWQEHDETSQACGDLYRTEIAAVGKGIVLMHDALYTSPGNVNGGNTVDMVKYIVPLLKADGYTFVGVDQVPDIAALLPALPVPDAGPEAGADAGSDAGAEAGADGGTDAGAKDAGGATDAGSSADAGSADPPSTPRPPTGDADAGVDPCAPATSAQTRHPTHAH